MFLRGFSAPRAPVFPKRNFCAAAGLSLRTGGQATLAERGLQMLNVEVVGEAYAIATHEPLLEIIVQLFRRG